jgi:hypothetical protein
LGKNIISTPLNIIPLLTLVFKPVELDVKKAAELAAICFVACAPIQPTISVRYAQKPPDVIQMGII